MATDDHGKETAIGVEVDGEIVQGFHTLTKKLDFYCEWFKDWKWPEYAIPIYPTTKEDRVKMTHLVSKFTMTLCKKITNLL